MKRNGARQSGQSGFLPVQKLLAGPGVPRRSPLAPLLPFILLPCPSHPFERAGGEDSGESTWQRAALRASHESRGLLFPPLLRVHATRARVKPRRETTNNFLARVRSGFLSFLVFVPSLNNAKLRENSMSRGRKAILKSNS